MNRIYPQVWLSLAKDVRNHLVQVFDIQRSGVAEIRDQEIVSDGYSVEDLDVITLEAMCEYIGSEETFGRAWEVTLAKVHAELNPPVAIIGKPADEDTRPSVADLMESKTNKNGPKNKQD